MKLRVVQSGIYNDQSNKASHYEVNDGFETLPAYGASLVESGYAVPFMDEEISVIAGGDAPVETGDETLGGSGTLAVEVDESTFVEELMGAGLSHRAASELSFTGYRSWGDLSRALDDDLLAVTWVGEGTLEKIREFVKRG